MYQDCLLMFKKNVLMADINKPNSILVLASKVQSGQATIIQHLGNSCLHLQLFLNHPCSCLCPSAARNRKWALAKRTCWERLHQLRHGSLYRQSDDSPRKLQAWEVVQWSDTIRSFFKKLHHLIPVKPPDPQQQPCCCLLISLRPEASMMSHLVHQTFSPGHCRSNDNKVCRVLSLVLFTFVTFLYNCV